VACWILNIYNGYDIMLYLSEIMIQNHDLEKFDDLKPLIQEAARKGEMFFRMDVTPPFSDTPENWEDQLEAVFSGALR